jgi:hypothetical protein
MATGLPSLKALRAFSTIAVWKVQLVAHVGDELRLELAALLGDLLKQTGVLERDRRLIGEGLHEGHDRRRELPRMATLRLHFARER